jgi:hypothetical protein
MTSFAQNLSLALAASLSVIACEPDIDVGERLRTTPSLDDAASCEALDTDLRTAIGDEFDARLLMGARSSSVGGYDEQTYVFGIDDELPFTEDPASMDAPRFADGPGLRTRLERAPDLGTDTFVGIVAGHLSVFVVTGGEPSVTASFPIDGTPITFARSGRDFILLSRIEPFSLVENHPLRPFLRNAVVDEIDAEKLAPLVAPFARVTRLSLSGTTFNATESLFVEGDPLGLTRTDDSVVVATRYYTTPIELRTYPQLDTTGFLDVFTAGRAFAESSAHNAGIIDQMELDDFVPRLVRTVASTTERVDFPCTRTLSADDMPGRAIVTFATFDLAESAPPASVSVDALRTSHANITAGDGSLFVVENAAPLWWYWGATGVAFESNVHHLAIERAGLAPMTSSRVLGLLGAGQSTAITETGALALVTRDIVYALTLDDGPGMSMLHLVDGEGAVTTTNAGFPSGTPPLGLHRLFDDLLFETALAQDDALLFDGETLAGGAPVRIPGQVQAMLSLDDETAYAVELSFDANGFPNGFTRIFEFSSASPWTPTVRLTIGTAIPQRPDVDPITGETPVIDVPFFSPVDRALFYVDDRVMLLPRSDGFGGTSLAVVAVRRDEGLSLVSTVSDMYNGDATASLIDRALVDDDELVTVGGGGIVVRGFPDLAETGRYVGGAAP